MNMLRASLGPRGRARAGRACARAHFQQRRPNRFLRQRSRWRVRDRAGHAWRIGDPARSRARSGCAPAVHRRVDGRVPPSVPWPAGHRCRIRQALLQGPSGAGRGERHLRWRRLPVATATRASTTSSSSPTTSGTGTTTRASSSSSPSGPPACQMIGSYVRAWRKIDGDWQPNDPASFIQPNAVRQRQVHRYSAHRAEQQPERHRRYVRLHWLAGSHRPPRAHLDGAVAARSWRAAIRCSPVLTPGRSSIESRRPTRSSVPRR